jgi:hypothetical protein
MGWRDSDSIPAPYSCQHSAGFLFNYPTCAFRELYIQHQATIKSQKSLSPAKQSKDSITFTHQKVVKLLQKAHFYFSPFISLLHHFRP